MNILAVDTAGKTVGVALLQDDRLLYECYLDAGMTHSETLMPLIDNCLKFCGMGCRDIDLYGVQCRPRQLYRPAHRAGGGEGSGLPPGDALRPGVHAGSAGGGPHRLRHRALCAGCPPCAGVQRGFRPLRPTSV